MERNAAFDIQQQATAECHAATVAGGIVISEPDTPVLRGAAPRAERRFDRLHRRADRL